MTFQGLQTKLKPMKTSGLRRRVLQESASASHLFSPLRRHRAELGALGEPNRRGED